MLLVNGGKAEDGREPVPVGRMTVGAVPVGKGGELVGKKPDPLGAVPVGTVPVERREVVARVPEREAWLLEKKPPEAEVTSGLNVTPVPDGNGKE